MDRLQELTALINELDYNYYVLDKPKVSDYEYDRLYAELQALERDTGTVLPDSPTRRTGGEPLSAFEPHRHITRLYSLDKAQSKEELAAWAARSGLDPDDLDVTLEYKFDGLTVNLTYEGGMLQTAATRGNGITGEDITRQVMTIRTIPLRIPYTGRIEIRGEGIMRLSTLEKYNETASEPLKNARNAAAGALRNLNPAVTASRSLDAFFYSVGTIDDPPYRTQEEMLAFLRENGLPVNPFLGHYKSLDELFAGIDGVAEERPSLDYMIDGVVIKINDLERRRALGYTDKFPRGEIAYKFEAEEAETRVTGISWEMGRTGRLTPVAELEAVDLAGVTVKRATLNNYQEILKKRVSVGSWVRLRRSNDVIPEILMSIDEGPYTPPARPAVCPFCGSRLEENGAFMVCPNSVSCRPQLISRLAHYASRDAMDIEGFSEKTAGLLIDELGINETADLYRLAREELTALPGFKDKKADNLLAAIGKSKEPELHRFIYAIGIPGVGLRTAGELAARYGSFSALRMAKEEDLRSIQDIGGITAAEICKFFADERITSGIDDILCFVTPRDAEEPTAKGALDGKHFAFTGTLAAFSRTEAGKLAAAKGAVIDSAPTQKTDYLVAGEKAGSKLEKAKKMGITVLSEDEFLSLIDYKA